MNSNRIPNLRGDGVEAWHRVALMVMAGVLASMMVSPSLNAQEPAKAYMANGIKIGDLSQDSVIIWGRLTANVDRVLDGPGFIKSVKDGEKRLIEKHVPAQAQIPEGVSLDDIIGSVPGIDGAMRLHWWEPGDRTSRKSSDWIPATPKKGHTAKWHLKNLKPATRYQLKLEGKAKGAEKASIARRSSFTTAPADSDAASITFTAATCHDYLRRDDDKKGHRIYPAMKKLDPDFFVHAGDIEYFDKTDPYATRLDLARFKFTRLYSMPFQRIFHMSVPSYWMKDDHDTLKNDSWPGQTYGELTFDQGIQLFKEQFPVPEKTYRTARWGKNLQIWFVEGRDYRSPNTMKDGPEKSIWGKEQRDWLFASLNASDASYKILFTPTPIVGPDRKNKKDNYANAGFAYEGNLVRKELSTHKNLIVICGDRHWQYASIDTQSGLREFSCGAGAEEHAGGFSQNLKSPMHKYLAIKPGFISGHLESGKSGPPELTIKFHAVDGSVRYSEDIPLR